MENLIKELERIANSAVESANKKLKEGNCIGAAMHHGYSSGLQFAINVIKTQIALNGEKNEKQN